MPKIDLHEGETVEFKRQWTDQALEDLAAFANTRGGSLYVGVGDDGEVVGVADPEAEMQRIANTVASRLGLRPSVSRRSIGGQEVIEVRVEPARGVVGLNGRYRTRVGSTNRDLSPEELGRLVLQRSGQSWDGLPSPLDLDRVAGPAIRRFTDLAKRRLPEIDPNEPERILQNLGLLREGRLTNAAVLLFTERPQEIFPAARLRIGLFKGTQILDTHEFEGTLWEQLDGAMERFRRLLKVALDVRSTAPTLEGLQHREVWEYPLDALREAVTNALVHRDYAAPGDIQVRLLEDSLDIWNPGGLPEGIQLEQLRAPSHPSVLRNPLIARTFYSAGLVEQWGTGTTRILAWCREAGLPEPEFQEEGGGFRVVFLKDPYTPERLRAMGLNERQLKAVLYLKERGTIGNKDYQELTGASKPTVTRDLDELVGKGILVRKGGRGRGTRYTLKGSKWAQKAHNGLEKGS
ncbi:MAG: ATP-dependent DNA helicase [Fimbriimonadales bacterium]|nr:MAG: ATP-dependent DNA helicase [Fimbriimonadales bacterium]